MRIDPNPVVVSVILTLYNSRNHYKRALNSILSQSFTEYEIIIVDDGSTDEVETELFPLLKKYEFIKYLRHSNRKHPLSLNTGIRISSGEFISFLDSDDEYDRDFLKNRISFFQTCPDADLLYSPATLIGDEKDFFVPDAEDQSRLIHVNDCIIGGTFFGKKKLFEDLQGFSNTYSHDSDFFERALKSFKVIRYDSPDYIYHRDNPDSVTSKLKLSKQLK